MKKQKRVMFTAPQKGFDPATHVDGGCAFHDCGLEMQRRLGEKCDIQ